jgi:hypothetical protein
MNKKGFITHPVTVAVVTFILGFVLAVLLVKKIIPVNLPFMQC